MSAGAMPPDGATVTDAAGDVVEAYYNEYKTLFLAGAWRESQARIEQLEWAIVRTLYAGDIEPPNPAAPFWFREQLLRDAGLTMDRCRELMDLHRGEDRVARL